MVKFLDTVARWNGAGYYLEGSTTDELSASNEESLVKLGKAEYVTEESDTVGKQEKKPRAYKTKEDKETPETKDV
jgi:hypothetical protein